MAEKITLGEMKELIKEEKIVPEDLFGVESLIDAPSVQAHREAYVKALQAKLSGEYDARKRVEKDVNKDKDDWTTKDKEKDEKIKRLETESAKVKATELFGTKIKDRKLDDKQAKYLKSKQSDFVPDVLEAVEKEVDVFMDKKLEEFKETAKIFGHKTDEPKDNEPKGGGEPGTGGSEEDNELIPD